MSKSIYTFTVDKVAKVSEKRTEKYTDESGSEKERTISEEVEKKIPIEFMVKKPNRKESQEADMVFSIEMSRCIKAGILTKAMLMNKYSDNGGIASKEDNSVLDEAYKDLNELQLKMIKFSAIENRDEQEDKELEEVQDAIVKLKKYIVESETSYLSLFNHTADTKAQNKIILWYILFLSYYKDPSQNHEDFIPFFDGDTFEEKEQALFEMEDVDHPLYKEVHTKLANIISLWYFGGRDVDKINFDSLIKEADAKE